MEKFSRSKSSREGGIQPSRMHDLRSYSTTDYNPPSFQENMDYNNNNKEVTIKKGNNNNNNSRRISGSSSSKNWSFNIDPELQRKKRVAGYKAYAVEGKMKGSFRKSFRWIKDVVVHGFW